jgi:hypothetical protein
VHPWQGGGFRVLLNGTIRVMHQLFHLAMIVHARAADASKAIRAMQHRFASRRASAIAKRFAAVVVNYSSAKDDADRVVAEIKANGGRAIAVKGDVGKAARPSIGSMCW